MQDGPFTAQIDLTGRVKAGSRSAFSQLVKPHVPRLIALARRMLGSPEEAEEAVQAALASTWLARERLDPDKPVAAYLTTVTLNKCRDRIRRRKVAGLVGLGSTDQLHAIVSAAPDQEQVAVDRDLLSRTAKAIDRLPLKLREALVLVALDGRSQAEAAELLGVSEKTIETRIYRARQKLREKVDFS